MIYVDTSAFVKLIWQEDESNALQSYLADEQAALVSSVLLVVETRRAVQREAPTRMPRADLLLASVGQVGIGLAVVESASRLPEPMLRSLDAIHLATAMVLGDELEAVISYDTRLTDAAVSHGLAVVAPS